jgi:serine/threonine-protein phosphatase 4 regulatory subunit 1
MIADVAKSVGLVDTVTHILPLLEELVQDPEPAIKQQLVQQLGTLAKFCVTSEEGYLAIIHHILPVSARLLEDEKAEVRLAAANTLVEIANLLKPQDLGQHVLTIVLQLAHEDDSEETRMTAAELLNMLAECLGQDLCQQFIIPEMVSLSEDPVFRVRKSTALNFHNICKVGGEYVFCSILYCSSFLFLLFVMSLSCLSI